MPAQSTVHPALRPSAAQRQYGDDGLAQRLARRLGDLAVMAVVGPVVGTLAIVALHFNLAPQIAADADAARAREEQRALAILEDRAEPAARPVAPYVAPAPAPVAPAEPPHLTAAEFGAVQPTPDTRHMADWVVSRHDNGRLPFIVLDKRDARLYVFDAAGHLLDRTPVLLGSAHGDDTYPGIGDVPIPDVKPYQRTTAAGRFVTRPGLDADHTDVVWLDYDAALAMHRVINKVKSEHRLQRLASDNPKMRRISWGCINIPIDFFDAYISPVFGKHSGVTYVIPERKSFEEVFEKSAAPTATLADAGAPMAPRDIANR